MHRFTEYTNKKYQTFKNFFQTYPFTGKFAGVLIVIFTWYAGQIYTQRLDYWRKQSDSRLQEYKDLLNIASEMVIEMYPPNVTSKYKDLVDKKSIHNKAKQFEILYWGRSGLVVSKEAESCLKNLRQALLDSSDEWQVTPTEKKSSDLLRKKLNLISQALRDDYEKAATSWLLVTDIPDYSVDASQCNSSRDSE